MKNAQKIIVLLMLVLIAAAPATQPKDDVEVTTNPRILLRSDIPTNQLLFNGVRIGDLTSSIPKEKIASTEPPTKDQWFTQITGKDGIIYSADEKQRIFKILVPGRASFARALHILSHKDIQMKFGKADEIAVKGGNEYGDNKDRNYFYYQRKMEMTLVIDPIADDTGLAIIVQD